jgi:hypothetical protein
MTDSYRGTGYIGTQAETHLPVEIVFTGLPSIWRESEFARHP